jgi:periplasmic protein TonB
VESRSPLGDSLPKPSELIGLGLIPASTRASLWLCLNSNYSQEFLVDSGLAMQRLSLLNLTARDSRMTEHLESPSLWTNVKDLLMEPSIKIPRGACQEVFRRDGLDASLAESFKAFFRSTPRTDDVPVPPLWTKRREFSVAQAISVAAHALMILLVVVPVTRQIIPPPARTVPIVDLSAYPFRPPPAKDVAHGGGGGGVRRPEPPTKGKLPRWNMTQIAPPTAAPRPNPRMAVEATLLGPLDLMVPSPNDPGFGDPVAILITDSSGPGGGSGIGNGDGTGIGNGKGPGLGDGYDGGTGGDRFRPGVGGVGYPTCLYCPEPQYSEDARKAKFQGIVVLQATIEPDGHAIDVHLVKGAGLGLDERALGAVRNWRFRPAPGPNGRPVATVTTIEVNFRLL